MKLQNMKRGETTEQITLFNWADINANIRMYRNDHLKMYKITL